MSKRMLIIAVGALVALAIAPSGASAASATPSCNGGSCTPWFKGDVALHWTFDPDPPTDKSPSCDDQTISAEGDNLVTCSATWDPPGPPPATLTPFTVHVKIDNTAPTVTGATPSGATANAAGWFSSPVSFTFGGSDPLSGVSSCQTVGPYSGDNSATASVSGTCTDNVGNTSAPSLHTFKYDATSPVIASVNPSRPPDAGGWYNHPLSVSATSSTPPGPSLIICGPVAYGGPDGAAIPVTAGCATGAGLSASKALAINYDATAPAVTGAAADRPPDHGGYYNHPVTFTFTGADAVSGIQGCDRVTYSGPDDSTAHVTGSCHDNAGNINIRSFEFKYDGTRPRTPKLVATPGSKRVDLSWTDTDATSFVVTRSVVGGGAVTQTAYSGSGSNFVDTHVRNGVRYIYTVTGSDNAGNTSSASIRAIPTASSLRPFAGTAVGSAPLLTWKKVKRARYYNIQLWRGGKKVLTAWPGRASFQVPQKWRFKGRRYSISSGHYRWWVWPGYGPRKAHRYGKALGTSSFRLRT